MVLRRLLLLVHLPHHHLGDGRQQRMMWWGITGWWAKRISVVFATSEYRVQAQMKVNFVGSLAQCGATLRSAIQMRRIGLMKPFLQCSWTFDTEAWAFSISTGNFHFVRASVPERLALPASNVAVGSVFNLDFLFFTYFMEIDNWLSLNNREICYFHVKSKITRHIGSILVMSESGVVDGG